ncbi:MAG: hypothetical protein R3E95_13070 [Thiolinea sp.]
MLSAVEHLPEKSQSSAADTQQHDQPDNVCIEYLLKAGIKAERARLEELAVRFGNDELTLTLLGAYLKRWHAGRLIGLETIPSLLPNEKQGPQGLRCVLAAFENRLRGASDLTLLNLLSLSDRPLLLGHVQNVFRSTLLERWLTRRDDYVRFLSPLGRLNQENWHWVIENLRRLQLLERPVAGQHDLLYVAEPIRRYFSHNLQQQNARVFNQASHDIRKLFEDTVVDFRQRYRSTPELKTWVPAELQEELEPPVYQPVLWKHEELDQAQQHLKALRHSLQAIREQTLQLTQQLGQNPQAMTPETAGS